MQNLEKAIKIQKQILSQRISDSIAAWEKSIYYNMIWNNTLAMNAVINHKIKYYM